MFIGHFALAFGAKRAAPGVSLGLLFAACQLAGLIWQTLVLVGVERFALGSGATAVTARDFVSYPCSPSLLTLCIWGAALGGIYVAVRRAPLAAGVTLALLVVSHWVLDAVSH